MSDAVDSKFLHEHALAVLAEADLALAHAPGLAIAEPHAIGDVTRAWLQEVLAGAVPGARLIGLVEEEAHDGMTSRMKWSLQWNETGAAAGLPAMLFAKATPPAGYLRETLAMLHMHELETRFYRQIQPENPDLAPRAHYARSYPGGRFLILLEGLEEKGCRPYWQVDECGIDHVRAVVVALAGLHAKYWGSDRFQGDLAWVRPRTRRFGWTWLRQSFGKTRNAFLEQAGSEILPPAAAELLRRWDRHADAVFDHWEHKPRTLLHGDSHVGNTFSYPDGRAGLFDWQVIFAGSGLRDLAYFMLSALSNENRIVHEKPVFQLYLDVLAGNGVVLDRDRAWNDYCLFALDRWDAAIKSYTHGFYGHATSGQLRSLKSIVGSLLDNDVGGRLDSLLQNELA